MWANETVWAFWRKTYPVGACGSEMEQTTDDYAVNRWADLLHWVSIKDQGILVRDFQVDPLSRRSLRPIRGQRRRL